MSTAPTHEARAVRSVPLSQRINGAPPARSLPDAYRLCDPFTPLDPEIDDLLRTDLDPIRGDDHVERIARSIQWSGDIPTLHFLSGHIGTGKTTELLRMQRHLERSAPEIKVLYLDADLYLDRYEADLEDIVIALWSIVLDQGPADSGKILAEVWSARVRSAFTSFVVNLPDKVPDALAAVLGQLRLQAIEERRKLRVAVSSVLSALVDGLNRALATMRHSEASSVVLLIDNLEKLNAGQREKVERLYLERMGALKSLDVHLVLTVPLFLCSSPAGASLTALYGGELVVLPTIKVRRGQRDGGGNDATGIAAVVDILQRRVAFRELFEGDAAAAEAIARCSGGVIQHALRMVRWAVGQHDAPPVSLVSVERAAAVLRVDFERALPGSGSATCAP